MKYNIHPDFTKLNYVPPLSPVILRFASPVMKAMLRNLRASQDVCVKRYSVAGFQDRKVSMEVYTPKHLGRNAPCLLYFHGGAFCFRAALYHKKLALRYAEEAGCTVVFPDYHLLPKYPFPAAQTDAISVYDWLYEHSEEIGIDSRRIAVGGDSAGAILAAAVCAHAPDDICFQMLLYPALDVRMETESMRVYTDTPLWNARLNRKLWDLYLRNTLKEIRETASPMQWVLPEHIPDTYIETAEFDCLHDEGVGYAARLIKAGAQVTLNETKGTIHGYDFVLDSPITEKSILRRIELLKLAFNRDI